MTSAGSTPAADSPVVGMESDFPSGAVAGFCLLLAGAAMLVWNGGVRPDPIIDFGRELYVAWQLAEGRVLYADIAYFNGPLSPYLNSLWFRISGASLQTLVICNVLVAAAATGLLFRLLRPISDSLSATVACLFFVAFFALGQIDFLGNYNFVTPYAHEVTHGVVLALLGLFAFSYYPRVGLRAIAAAGICLGLVFLTKPEPFLAAAAALGTGCVLTWRCGAPGRESLLRFGVALAGGALLPPLVAWGCLCAAMPAKAAAAGVLAPWLSASNTELVNSEFYRALRGTNRLGASFELIGIWLRRYSLVLIPIAALALVLRRPKRIVWVLASVLGVGAVGFVRLAPKFAMQSIRPLPVLVLLMLIGSVWVLVRDVRAGRAGPEIQVSIQRVVFVVFSVVLLAKIFFNVSLIHYGFALAMPATMLLVVTWTCWLPRLIGRLSGSAALFRFAALWVLLVAALSLLRVIDTRHADLSHPLGSGGDAFLTDWRSPMIGALLADLGKRVGPDETILVLPEGVMINYLARRETPTRYVNFMPPELILFGEAAIVEALDATPPDHVVLIHREAWEYGQAVFGAGYGRAIWDWVAEHYRPAATIGDPPFQQGTQFGALILEPAGSRTGSKQIDPNPYASSSSR